ncbi:MAG: hypothetical protein EPO07_03415, partial [Verrucomicrobia bacterium]
NQPALTYDTMRTNLFPASRCSADALISVLQFALFPFRATGGYSSGQIMRTIRRQWILVLALACGLSVSCRLVQHVGKNTPTGILVGCLNQIYDVVEPVKGAPAKTFQARFRIVETVGVSTNLLGREVEIAVRPPDHLYLTATVSGKDFKLGRDGQQLWIYALEKKFYLIGESGVARFAELPDSKDSTQLGPLRLPWSRKILAYVPRLVSVERQPDARVGRNDCCVLLATPRPAAVKAHRLPDCRLQLWVRRSDRLPTRISYTDDRGVRVTVEAEQLELRNDAPETRWTFSPVDGDRTQTVAISHLTQFLSVRWSLLNAKIPSLGPATGQRRVVASEGEGRLENIDGTTVLFVKGSPEEMGRQHGALLAKKVREDARRILYGVGIGSSLANGTWFFGEMNDAERRLLPHMDGRYLREMDAMAVAAGISKEEMRMANVFPELFHCTGFAIYGDATVGGTLYHGRVLDYFRGMGLEQNAVVMIFQPDVGNAWVNISYAGFVGSVTAMNAKGVAIGEMGGHGEGQWDGKPMAQLVREVMEKANTIDDAVEIMRRGPRTCEYYYVISDGKTRRAVAIRATPTEFETAWAGEKHPLLPETIKDAVFVS